MKKIRMTMLMAVMGMLIGGSQVAAANSKYYTANPTIVKAKKGLYEYKDVNRTKRAKLVHKGTMLHVIGMKHTTKKTPVLKVSGNYYVTANKQYVAKTSGYQNPKQYYQVANTQIKPYGKVGYMVKRNYEGIKTWKIMKKMGTFYGYNKYNTATYNAVKAFQSKHHLKVTGNVDEKTWVKMGFSKSSFTAIDSYIAPLGAHAWNTRSQHIEAMIKQAYKYKNKLYLVGSSSEPSYGTDCSGLAMQAMYAGGVNPLPTSSIHHAYPGNEWNSRNLWAAKKLRKVAYNQRQRGDLIFYYQPGTHTIWHVAIYLGHNKVIESWPPKIMVQPIQNSQRSDIAGVKRVFN
ncbi:DUF5776 domain-containing protein [Lentilactobacillus kribbianus]|uniref:DUF5776 domain-containing protein n=1 Tax=Lentilactobacillus kribbianus TaxID=2729622 RepID=UPI00155507E4|nr:DUF5776 domain-containing protein [Lentilactobacillus kribbianus]